MSQNESELFHSDIYLGEDYSDGIRHWKYVKREKLSNGKYRYYYKDDELDKAQKEYSKATKDYLGDKLATDFNLAAARNHASGDNHFHKDDTKAANHLRKYNDAAKRMVESSKRYEDAYNKLKKVQIKSIPRKIFASGIAAIGNLLQRFKK